MKSEKSDSKEVRRTAEKARFRSTLDQSKAISVRDVDDIEDEIEDEIIESSIPESVPDSADDSIKESIVQSAASDKKQLQNARMMLGSEQAVI